MKKTTKIVAVVFLIIVLDFVLLANTVEAIEKIEQLGVSDNIEAYTVKER